MIRFVELVAPAPFSHHVGGIVGHSAQKQMVRPNAGRIVAFVADDHSFWNWAVMDFPREPVRSNPFAAISTGTEKTVTAFVESPGPYPAFGASINSVKEALLGIDRAGFVAAGKTAKSALSVLRCIARNCELFGAMFTRSGYFGGWQRAAVLSTAWDRAVLTATCANSCLSNTRWLTAIRAWVDDLSSPCPVCHAADDRTELGKPATDSRWACAEWIPTKRAGADCSAVAFDRLILHRMLTPFGVMLPAGPTVREHFDAQFYHA